MCCRTEADVVVLTTFSGTMAETAECRNMSLSHKLRASSCLGTVCVSYKIADSSTTNLFRQFPHEIARDQAMKHLSLAVLLLTVASSKAGANDIVDVLKALQHASHDRHDFGHRPGTTSLGHGHVRGGYSSRDVYKHYLLRSEYYSRLGYGLPNVDSHGLQGYGRTVPNRRSAAILNVQYGGAPLVIYGRRSPYGVAPVPALPLSHQLAPAPSAILPHRLGETIDSPVTLVTADRIKDPDHVAPGAVPVVVAIRDPALCAHKCDCCVERLVYVEVCVPACPLKKLKLSHHNTYVCMNYGDHQVEITSRNGRITVDYDD
jgi:hypothetical protein